MKIKDTFNVYDEININTFERVVRRGFVTIIIVIEDRRTDLSVEEYKEKYKHHFHIEIFKRRLASFSFRSMYVYDNILTNFAKELLFCKKFNNYNNNLNFFL